MQYTVRLHAAAGVSVCILAVGASVLASTFVASRAYERRGEQVVRGSQDLSVRGSARTRVRSDLAAWSVTVRSQAPTLPEAYGRLEASSARVGQFMTAAGFAPGEVALGAIATRRIFKRDDEGRQTDEVIGYELSRSVRVASPAVDRVAKAAGEVTTLLREGVEVMPEAPEFLYSKLPELRVTLSGEAAADARRRADELAGKAGCVITAVRSVSAGPFQVTAPDATDARSGGSYDTATIEKDVWISVNASFGIEGR